MDRARISDIGRRLEGVSEELGDIGLEVLRAAVEAGASKRPDADKKIAAARRAVDKACRLLEALTVEPDEDQGI